MQLIATVLALAAFTAATPHLHHRHVHQKKSPADLNEALAGSHALPSATIVTSAVVTPVTPTTVASSPVQPVAVATTLKTASSVAAPSPAASKVAASVKITDISGIVSRLSSLSCQQGHNSQTNNGAVWIGNDGAYTNTFTNSAASEVILVIWGEKASWVNAQKPHITVPLAPGASVTVSFANGQIGGWAGIYPDTVTQNGQIMNTWGEYTFSDPWSTVDVSREVKMSGNGMSIQTPKCLSDMNTCVFVCTDGSDSCWYDYTLKNCENGSQPGAQKGTFAGAASGGCGNMGSSAHLTTTFS